MRDDYWGDHCPFSKISPLVNSSADPLTALPFPSCSVTIGSPPTKPPSDPNPFTTFDGAIVVGTFVNGLGTQVLGPMVILG